MTAQAHEKLLYEGEQVSMSFCPPLPEGHPRIIEVSPDEIDHNEPENFLIGSTACWRGYIGSWEIRNGKFYLTGISGRYKMTGETPVFADWFSGTIRIPKGKQLHYVHAGFETVYEKEIHVNIEKGLVIKTKEADNRAAQNCR
ncbi:hypothetical protein QUF72_04785 [Desulfobacterales bacterium HSG2]|nr:hypothetical protein [Desulfobacterales bacterium HSG2]